MLSPALLEDRVPPSGVQQGSHDSSMPAHMAGFLSGHVAAVETVTFLYSIFLDEDAAQWQHVCSACARVLGSIHTIHTIPYK